MRYSKTARTYAESLYVFGQDANALGKISADAEFVLRTIDANAEFRRLLASPIIKLSDKDGILSGLFGASLSPEFLRFLRFLIQKDRINLLQEILSTFFMFKDDREDNLRVTVEAATELTEAQKELIRKSLEERYKKNIFITPSVNTELIGGFVVRVGDMVIDASIQNKLADLRKKFSGA